MRARDDEKEILCASEMTVERNGAAASQKLLDITIHWENFCSILLRRLHSGKNRIPSKMTHTNTFTQVRERRCRQNGKKSRTERDYSSFPHGFFYPRIVLFVIR